MKPFLESWGGEVIEAELDVTAKVASLENFHLNFLAITVTVLLDTVRFFCRRERKIGKQWFTEHFTFVWFPDVTSRWSGSCSFGSKQDWYHQHGHRTKYLWWGMGKFCDN